MAYCKNCGAQNADSASFCVNCGSVIEKTTPANVPPSQPAPASPGGASNKSIIAMILGIVSIIGSCGPVTGIAAIILANQELKAIRSGLSTESGRTLCQIALWTGWIGTIVCGLFWIGYVLLMVFFVSAGLHGIR
jgi:hypothetical protein